MLYSGHKMLVFQCKYMICIWEGEGISGKESTCQCKRHRFDPWVEKIPWGKMTSHSSILAWEIPWTEEPGGLQSMGSQTVRHDWMTKQQNNFISSSGKESWLQRQLHRLPATIKWDYIFSEVGSGVHHLRGVSALLLMAKFTWVMYLTALQLVLTKKK